ncbi:MAG: pirin family protein [Nannocystis sp.]|nr:pirin family protein [Nannocystis sp.]MBA3547471.1 pirin family protein [Nannocystis sp.]
MLTIRRSHERGHADHGWLDSHHTFSFADYHDPRHMGFRTLRVINEDCVAPGKGFGTHSHRDMEIISYVLAGALEHKDSLGTGSVIRPGDVQRMSAGTGVAHSEFNSSHTEPVHFLQIWILPETRGSAPGYEQKRFEPEARSGRLRLIASRDGREGSVVIHQDVALYAALLAPGQSVTHSFAPGRHGWLQVARGAVTVGDATLRAGDGAALEQTEKIEIAGVEAAELLLFDLA